MRQRSFRILLLEDNDWDAGVVTEALQSSDETRGFQTIRTRNLGETEQQLDGGAFDLVLCDLNVGDSRGLDTLRRLLRKGLTHLPIIVMTGSVSDQLGVAAVKEGAVDFIGKDRLDPRRLALSVRFAIERGDETLRLATEVEKLKSKAAARETLFNAVAHELNNPITPLALQLHMFKSGALGELTDEQNQCVVILDRNVGRLQSLLRDFLDVARLESGRLRLRPGPCDLAQLAREVCETYQPLAKGAGVALLFEGIRSAPVMADPTRLTQVAYNFLSNAVKYTPSGGRIVVRCGMEGDGVAVRVTDQGVGLTAEQMSALFRPFSQVLSESGGQKPGTGLGLFVSKGLVEAHGGTIWCESAGPGKGSTFGFKVPATPPGGLEARPVGSAA